MTISIRSNDDVKRFIASLLTVNTDAGYWIKAFNIEMKTWTSWATGQSMMYSKSQAKIWAVLEANQLTGDVETIYLNLGGTLGTHGMFGPSENGSSVFEETNPSTNIIYLGSNLADAAKRAEGVLSGAQDDLDVSELLGVTDDDSPLVDQDDGGVQEPRVIPENNNEKDDAEAGEGSGSGDEPPFSEGDTEEYDDELNWPKRWKRSHRQELFLPIHKFIWLYPPEKKIVATPAFQRLRLLSQLGMSYVSFPGATHKRFEHVLGTVAVTDKIVRAINHNCEKEDRLKNSKWQIVNKKLTLQETMLVRLAALLHDIGHLPFGHTIEDELNLITKKHDEPERLANVFERKQWFGMVDEKLLHPAEVEDQSSLGETIDSYYNDLLDPETELMWKESLDIQNLQSGDLEIEYNGVTYKIKLTETLLTNVLRKSGIGLSLSDIQNLNSDLHMVLKRSGEQLKDRKHVTSLISVAISRRLSADNPNAWSNLKLLSFDFGSNLEEGGASSPRGYKVKLTAQIFVQFIILKYTKLPENLQVRYESDEDYVAWRDFQKNTEFSGESAKIDFARAVHESVEDLGFRLGVCRDIVGNTICADLLDYLHRDWYHTGRVKEFDERIFQYMEMRKGKDEPRDKPSTHIVIAIDSLAGLRLDGMSAILDLLESRYQLAETVLFHKTKIRATAMMERSIMLYYQVLNLEKDTSRSAEERLLEFLLSHPEDGLIHAMVNGTAFELTKNDDKSSTMTTARRISYALMCRRYYKDLLIKYDGQLTGDYTRERAIHAYATDLSYEDGSPDRSSLRRQATLEILEHDFRLPLGSLAFYCPGDKMNAKVAQVRILAKGFVRPFHKHKESVKQELSGGHLEAQMRRFQSLWRVVFYFDELVVRFEIQKALSAISDQEGPSQGFTSWTKTAQKRHVSGQAEIFVKLLRQAVSAAALKIADEGRTPDETYKRVIDELKALPWFKYLGQNPEMEVWPNATAWLKVARGIPTKSQLKNCDFPSGVTRPQVT